VVDVVVDVALNIVVITVVSGTDIGHELDAKAER